MPTFRIDADDVRLAITTDRGRVLVDASAHELLVDVETKTAGGVEHEIWELGASRAGLRTILRLVADDLGLQRLSPDDAAAMQEAVVGALRRSAQGAGLRLTAVERQVASVQATPLLYSAPFLRADFLRDDAVKFQPCRVALAHVEDDHDDDTPEGAFAMVARLAQWRDLFAPDGRSRRPLNATLTEFGEAASANALWGLRRVALTRRAPSLLHVQVLGAIGADPRAPVMKDHARVVENASTAELQAAVASAQEARWGLPPAVQGPHALAELLALVVVRPGADVDALRLDVVLEAAALVLMARLPLSTKVAVPPIPPPTVQGLRLLKTCREIVDEGLRMQHCVGLRRFDAVDGRAFIFHAADDRSEATVQVNARGCIVEARGPKNDDNQACQWASRHLSLWGKGFWAAQLGMDASTWRHKVPAPPSSAPLRTVAECYAVYRRTCDAFPDYDERLTTWYTRHVAAAVRGEEWLAVTIDGRFPAVAATDRGGRIIAHTQEVLQAREADPGLRRRARR